VPNTVYVARDESGIFLFDGRPTWEKDPKDANDDGIWIEANGVVLVLELKEAQAVDILGFPPVTGACYDVTVISTLIEQVDA
jgi:hypothetical protein